MTRREFERRAIRQAEKDARLPTGWFGTYRHAQSGTGVDVKWMRDHWNVYDGVKIVSKHDSREFAIKKARRLVDG